MEKRWLCSITFDSWKVCENIGVGNLGLHLPPFSLDSHQSQIQPDKIFDWPHILISLKDNSSFWWIRLITVGHLPIKAEWLDAPLALHAPQAQLTLHTTKTENRPSIFPTISSKLKFTISKNIGLCRFCLPGKRSRTFVVTTCCAKH